MSIDRDVLLADALLAEEHGDLPRAIMLLEAVIGERPKDVKTRTWLGKLYADREQFAAARENLEYAIAIDSTSARSYAVLAEVLIGLESFWEAEQALRKSIELSPSSEKFVLLGYTLTAQARRLEAQRSYRRALEMDAENEEAMYNLAIEIRRTDPAEASKLLESALRIDPLYADAYREYGFQLAMKGETTRAEEAYRTAIRLDESDSLAHVYLANVLASTERIAEAESELKRACELSPLDALPHWGLAKLYEAQGRSGEAESLFRQAVILAPSNAEAVFQLSRFLVGVGARREGAEWLTRVLELSPTHEAAIKLRQALSG